MVRFSRNVRGMNVSICICVAVCLIFADFFLVPTTKIGDIKIKSFQLDIRNGSSNKGGSFKSRETDFPSGNDVINKRSKTGSNITDITTVAEFPQIKLSKTGSNITDINIVAEFPQKPRQHVAFLKVHKAASSTAQNILLRYGYQRNLTFVLPRPPKFWYPNIISLSESVNEGNTLPPPKNKTFDILCCHVIYNRMAFAAIMPNDTVYIGIVREPSELFISTIQYMHPIEIAVSNSISNFLQNPGYYVRNKTDSWVHNRMAYEYNFPKELFQTKNETDINTYLQTLATDFSLVIVVEYFEESVVLMRRILHWNIKDVLYVKKNASNKKNAPELTLEDKQRHRQWAVLEYALYDFFLKRLWAQVENEGKDFYDELQFFKRVRRKVTDFCLGAKKRSKYKIKKSKWSKEAVVTSDDCKLMFKPEIQFVQTIRLNQYGNLSYGRRTHN